MACRTKCSGELARHRVTTASGEDYIAAAGTAPSEDYGFLVAVYPVRDGYLVMFRQPLVQVFCADDQEAIMLYDDMVSVLVEEGARALRAREVMRRRIAAQQRHAEEAWQRQAMDTLGLKDHEVGYN